LQKRKKHYLKKTEGGGETYTSRRPISPSIFFLLFFPGIQILHRTCPLLKVYSSQEKMLHKQYILFHVMGTLRPLLLQQDSQRRERSRSSVSKHVIWMVFWTSLLTSLSSSFLHMLTERKNPGPTDGHEAEDQGTNKDVPTTQETNETKRKPGHAQDELRGGNTRGKPEKTEEERTAGHHTFIIGFMPSSRPSKLPAPSIYNCMGTVRRLF